MRNPQNPDHITYEKAQEELVGKLGVPYLECSALTRKGVEEIFSTTVKAVIEKRKIMEVKKIDRCCRVFWFICHCDWI